MVRKLRIRDNVLSIKRAYFEVCSFMILKKRKDCSSTRIYYPYFLTLYYVILHPLPTDSMGRIIWTHHHFIWIHVVIHTKCPWGYKSISLTGWHVQVNEGIHAWLYHLSKIFMTHAQCIMFICVNSITESMLFLEMNNNKIIIVSLCFSIQHIFCIIMVIAI